LKDRLRQEEELLLAYQSQQRKHMEQQQRRENDALNERVSLRRALLEQKVGWFPCSTGQRRNQATPLLCYDHR
jgi:hypothetical protein